MSGPPRRVSPVRRARRAVTRPVVRAVAWLLPWPYHAVMGLIWRSCRVQRVGMDEIAAAVGEHGGVVLAYFHENLVLAPYALAGFRGVSLSSRVDAGTLVAGTLKHFGFQVVRTRKHDTTGMFNELRRVVLAERGRSLALAVDGPSGPRRVVKPGAAIMARSLKMPVFAMHIGVSRGWCWPSWCGCRMPLPLGRITMRVDRVEPPAQRGAEALTQAIQEQMDETAERAEAHVPGGGARRSLTAPMRG